MAFKKGETVSILTESGAFTVLEVGIHRSKLEDEFGFERQVPNSLIVPRQKVAGHVHQKDAEVITPPSSLLKEVVKAGVLKRGIIAMRKKM